ncbi:MAG: hypothetical protein OXF28_01115 [Thaumarchaeota archaeon]|nr:hypothetical protein [Nitrososphaerota archaeon]MCY3975722.1 hypothetical protein [Nitrososphaerota archaeon]
MKKLKKHKVKILLLVFLFTGMYGILLGLFMHKPMVTILGVINLSLGGFFGWLFFNKYK